MILTIGLLIDEIKKVLANALYPETEIKAITRILFKHFCGLNTAELYLSTNKGIEPEIAAKIIRSLRRLEEHEPLQYILGETEFYGLLFKVDENVLIPRPETEELVHWIITDFANFKSPSFSILDIGTGSGAIAISLAKNIPESTVYAVDISAEALKMAEINAEINGVSIHFLQKDILKNTLDLPFKFDCIVSNPPYVCESEKKLMQSNVLDYEPHTALFVDDSNPLIFYDAVAHVAIQYLNTGGSIYLEINEALPLETQKVFNNYGFATLLKKDINDKPRMVKAF